MTPFLLIVAGPNGSGKTTVTSLLRASGIDFGQYINPDDIALTLEGSYDLRVRRAQQIADEARETCLREGRSFSFETVMSHPSKLEVMSRARQAGFEVELVFVCTDSADINVARVGQRVAAGGHDVPDDKIRERYGRTLRLLRPAMEIAHRSTLFDNTRIAGLRRVLECETDPSREPKGGKLTLSWRCADDLPAWVSTALPELT